MHIANLAGFTESAVAIPVQQRFLWERIEKRFKRLGSRISPKDRKRIEAVLIAKIGKPPHAGALGCEGVVADGRPKRIGLQKQRRWCRHQGSAASSQEGRESPATAKLLGFSLACQSSHMRRYAASTLRRNRSVSNNG